MDIDDWGDVQTPTKKKSPPSRCTPPKPSRPLSTLAEQAPKKKKTHHFSKDHFNRRVRLLPREDQERESTFWPARRRYPIAHSAHLLSKSSPTRGATHGSRPRWTLAGNLPCSVLRARRQTCGHFGRGFRELNMHVHGDMLHVLRQGIAMHRTLALVTC